MKDRFRPLLIAETCNPEWVSVPLVGWSHARAIIEAAGGGHIATQVRNREALLRAGLVEGRDFTSIDTEPIVGPMYRLAGVLRGGKGKGWTTSAALMTLIYPYFEWIIEKKLGARIDAGEFDVVHRLTPLTQTSPSPLAARCRRAGVPFVLGPLNGGVPWPPGFDAERRKENEWLSYVRGVYKLLPGYRSTRTAASAILVASRDTWGEIPAVFHRKCFYMPENAIDPARFTARRTRTATRPLRVIFLGRLVPYKGADMLLTAAAPLVKRGDVTVQVIGDGPQMGELKAIVEREGIAGGVTLAGWVEHAKVQEHLVDADLFAFPSVREFGGGVTLEAMAVGIVPAVVDYGGPAELVTPKTGFLIPIGTREQIVAGYRALLERLVQDPRQIDERSAPAARRAHQQFTWTAKAAQDLEIYRWVCNPGSPKPNFLMPAPDL